MSIAASAENTMNTVKIINSEQMQENNNNNNNNDNNDNSVKENEDDDNIFFKNTANDSDDDMVVIILEEEEEETSESSESETEQEQEQEQDEVDDSSASVGEEDNDNHTENKPKCTEEKESTEEKEKQNKKKQHCIGGDVLFIDVRNAMEIKKLYPLLPCAMISSFTFVMEYVEYFDIESEDRKKLVIDLVKSLAYSNNEYGSRECFEYFVKHNMIEDIVKTVIDCTKNKYDINRYPHTNRKIVLSYVSLSNKIKGPKPIKFDSLFDFKINLCGIKRFFKMKEKEKEKDESKQM